MMFISQCVETERVTEVCCGLCQIAARVREALEPTTGLKQTHLPGMLKHVEELREEIIRDNVPLSKINIVTDDAELLNALGPSGIVMGAAGEDADQSQGASDANEDGS